MRLLLYMLDFKTAAEHIKKVSPILLSKYGVNKIGIFGSVARNEQDDNSDIDILVEMNHRYTLFEIGGVYSILEEELKNKIDLSEINHLRPELADLIKKEVRYI